MIARSRLFLATALSDLALVGSVSATPVAIGSAPILTSPAPATPRVNGPGVFGVRPGAPFLDTIPATGQRPMTFAANELPAGLAIDNATGRITGIMPAKGEYTATLRARNALGEFKDSSEAKVAPHGVVLVRLIPPE